MTSMMFNTINFKTMKIRHISLLLMMLGIMGITMAQDNREIRVPSGYQGFLEQSNLYSLSKIEGRNETMVGFSTTHGFYFNGHTFVGVGFGFDANDNITLVPLYTSIKYLFNNQKNISPIFGLRMGSYVGTDNGAYGEVSLGLRFASTKDFAVSAVLAGVYYEPVQFYLVNTEGDCFYNFSGIAIKFSIEW